MIYKILKKRKVASHKASFRLTSTIIRNTLIRPKFVLHIFTFHFPFPNSILSLFGPHMASTYSLSSLAGGSLVGGLQLRANEKSSTSLLGSTNFLKHQPTCTASGFSRPKGSICLPFTKMIWFFESSRSYTRSEEPKAMTASLDERGGV